eukprot:g1775.t1
MSMSSLFEMCYGSRVDKLDWEEFPLLHPDDLERMDALEQQQAESLEKEQTAGKVLTYPSGPGQDNSAARVEIAIMSGLPTSTVSAAPDQRTSNTEKEERTEIALGKEQVEEVTPTRHVHVHSKPKYKHTRNESLIVDESMLDAFEDSRSSSKRLFFVGDSSVGP